MGLITSLVPLWKLNETSGARADANTSLTLTDNNTVGSAAGKIGNAASFVRANSECLTLSSDSTLDVKAKDFTLACWFNLASGPTAVFDSNALLCRRPGGGSFELRVLNNNPDTFIEMSFADAVAVRWGSALSLSTWYFVVAWRSVVDGKIYIAVNNGTPVETAYVSDEAGGAADFAIGARFQTTTSQFFDGLIDEAGIWVNRALSSDDRTKLWNSGRGREYPFENGPTAIPAALWLKGGGTYWQDSARTTSASADTDPVGSWYDESYGLAYAIQATSGSRPTLQTAEVNGVAAVECDGVDDILTSPVEVASGTPVTVIAVLRLLADGSFDYVVGDVISFRGIRVTSGRTISLCDGGQDIASPTPIAGDWVIVTGILDGTNGTLRVNGVQKATAASTVTGWLGGFTVGGQGTGANFQACQVAEVLLYDSALTGTDLTDVEDYLTAKYFAGGSGNTVTPDTASLSLTTFAPTVTASGSVTATPTTAALTTSLFAPTVSTPRTVTPSTVALSLASFAPVVSTPRLVTPGIAALSIGTFAPTIATPRTVTPGTASLTLTTFAPSASVSNGLTLVPGAASLSITSLAPTVLASLSATPGSAALSITALVPRIVLGMVSEPAPASLVLSSSAPVVQIPVILVPGATHLTLSLFAPSVRGSAEMPLRVLSGVAGYIKMSGEAKRIVFLGQAGY